MIVALFAFLHLAIALPLGWILNIWADEASTLYTTEHGISNALQHAITDEKQAPLYFWVLSIWREASSSIFFARFFSVLCSLLAIGAFWNLARRFFREKAAVFITAVFALHPFLIWASLEIRVYSLTVLLCILLIRYFHDGFLVDKPVRGARVMYVVIALVSLYTSYYLGFFLAAGFVALIVSRRFSAARMYFILMAIAGVLFLPLLTAVYLTFSAESEAFSSAPEIGEGLRLLWNFFLTFTLPTELFPPEDSTTISLVRLWIVRAMIAIAALLLIRNRKRFDSNIIVFAALAAVISGFFFLAYYFLGGIYVQVRHSAVLFVPTLFLVGLVVNNVLPGGYDSRKIKRPLVAAMAVLLIASFAYAVFTLYPQGVKRGDWANVAAHIQANEKPGQAIVVFTVFDALALPYYYKGQNKIVPDSHYFDFQHQAVHGTDFSRRKEAEFVISQIPPEANEIWLIASQKCSLSDVCGPLENFTKANYTIIEEKEFYLEKVFLLRRNSQ